MVNKEALLSRLDRIINRVGKPYGLYEVGQELLALKRLIEEDSLVKESTYRLLMFDPVYNYHRMVTVAQGLSLAEAENINKVLYKGKAYITEENHDR